MKLPVWNICFKYIYSRNKYFLRFYYFLDVYNEKILPSMKFFFPCDRNFVKIYYWKYFISLLIFTYINYWKFCKCNFEELFLGFYIIEEYFVFEIDLLLKSRKILFLVMDGKRDSRVLSNSRMHSAFFIKSQNECWHRAMRDVSRDLDACMRSNNRIQLHLHLIV